MNYRIEYLDDVFFQLSKIPKNIRNTIIKAIDERLATDPHRFGKHLKSEWKGYYRLRVGDCRIVYKVKEQEVIVVIIKICNRSNVYQ